MMGFGGEIAVGGKPDADLFPSKTSILSVQGHSSLLLVSAAGR